MNPPLWYHLDENDMALILDYIVEVRNMSREIASKASLIEDPYMNVIVGDAEEIRYMIGEIETMLENCESDPVPRKPEKPNGDPYQGVRALRLARAV